MRKDPRYIALRDAALANNFTAAQVWDKTLQQIKTVAGVDLSSAGKAFIDNMKRMVVHRIELGGRRAMFLGIKAKLTAAEIEFLRKRYEELQIELTEAENNG